MAPYFAPPGRKWERAKRIATPRTPSQRTCARLHAGISRRRRRTCCASAGYRSYIAKHRSYIVRTHPKHPFAPKRIRWILLLDPCSPGDVSRPVRYMRCQRAVHVYLTLTRQLKAMYERCTSDVLRCTSNVSAVHQQYIRCTQAPLRC